MSTQTEITRLQTARNKLRTKGVELGINTATDKLDVIATAYENIENRGAVSATVQEGDTYTIPKGYHNGSGTVSGVKGGGNYSLQSKTATPTKKQQNITPDSGYYGLSDVTVDPIPDNFQDVTPVTAGAADVLANKVIVAADGSTVAGTMPNNGAVTKTLDTTTTSQDIAKGYHSGSGKVSIALEEKRATPTKESQDITPTAGKVLSKVTVDPIPDAYQDVTKVTATASDVLKGKVIVDSEGNALTGTIPIWNDIDTNGLELPAGQGFTFDAGYHQNDITIYAQDLASQTPGDAAAANILTGKKAWVAGSQITGTMANNGTVSPDALAAGGSYTIPAGYHSGTGKVTAASLSSQTAGTAVPAQVLSGQTAWVGGTKLTGTMINRGSWDGNIDGLTATSVTIPAGYHSGTGTVSLTGDIEEALAAI